MNPLEAIYDFIIKNYGVKFDIITVVFILFLIGLIHCLYVFIWNNSLVKE